MTDYEQDKVYLIPLRQLRPDPSQPRVQFDEQKLQALADTLKEDGQETPIKFREASEEDGKGPRLIIVHGERRWRAAKLAGLKSLKAILDDKEDGHSARLLRQISDNTGEPISPWDWVCALRTLKEDHGLKVQEIADELAKRGLKGFSRPVVSNYLRLLTLPESIQELIKSAWLTPAHGKYLLGIKSEKVAERVAEQLLDIHKEGEEAPTTDALSSSIFFAYRNTHTCLNHGIAFDVETECKGCHNQHKVKTSWGADQLYCTLDTCREAKDAEALAAAKAERDKQKAAGGTDDEANKRESNRTEDLARRGAWRKQVMDRIKQGTEDEQLAVISVLVYGEEDEALDMDSATARLQSDRSAMLAEMAAKCFDFLWGDLEATTATALGLPYVSEETEDTGQADLIVQLADDSQQDDETTETDRAA